MIINNPIGGAAGDGASGGEDKVDKVPSASGQLPVFNASGNLAGSGIAPLATDISLHVAKTGDDAAGDGSQGAPYLTIQKAVDAAKLLYQRSQGISISIQDGVYAEAVVIKGFYGGELRLAASNNNKALVTIDSPGIGIEISTSGYIQVHNITVKASSLYAISTVSANVEISQCSLDGKNLAQGLSVGARSHVTVNGDILNCQGYAVYASDMGICYAAVSGSNNSGGYRANRGIILKATSNTLTAATMELCEHGGIITSNLVERTNVVNNLTSTATDTPLSAAMGKKLQDDKAGLPITTATEGESVSWNSIMTPGVHNKLMHGTRNPDGCQANGYFYLHNYIFKNSSTLTQMAIPYQPQIIKTIWARCRYNSQWDAWTPMTGADTLRLGTSTQGNGAFIHNHYGAFSGSSGSGDAMIGSNMYHNGGLFYAASDHDYLGAVGVLVSAINKNAKLLTISGATTKDQVLNVTSRILYHEGNIGVSNADPTAFLGEGVQLQVY